MLAVTSTSMTTTLWYTIRATGVVALVLLTVTTVLGLLSSSRFRTRRCGQKRPRTSGGSAALRSLWTGAASDLYAEQEPWATAPLCLWRQPRPEDGSQLRDLRRHARR